jgi:hypothetical protein
MLQVGVWCANIHLHLACHAGLAKKALAAAGQQKPGKLSKFQAISNKMYDILKMDVPGCEVKLAKVNTTLDAQLKVWRESGDKNQSAAVIISNTGGGKQESVPAPKSIINVDKANVHLCASHVHAFGH